MKLVWSAETASKAYIDTVKSCELFRESSVAELVSAMAAGWNAKFIVETWSKGGVITTSMGLAIARSNTNGRHVCIVPDETTRVEYIKAMGSIGASTEVHVGDLEEAMERLIDIDFLVLDSRRNDLATILKVAKLGNMGAVLVRKYASSRAASEFKWRNVVDGGSRRLVRSVFCLSGRGWILHMWQPEVRVRVRARGKGGGTRVSIGRLVKNMSSESEITKFCLP